MFIFVCNQVLGQTQDHRHRVLVAAARNIKVWFIKVRKIKAIYHTLNQFNLDVTQKCLIAECWCPVDDLDRIQQALRRGTVSQILAHLVFVCVNTVYRPFSKGGTRYFNPLKMTIGTS